MTTRTHARISPHVAWVEAFDAHITHLDSACWLDRNDDEAVAAWEAREAKLGALVDAAGTALDAYRRGAA